MVILDLLGFPGPGILLRAPLGNLESGPGYPALRYIIPPGRAGSGAVLGPDQHPGQPGRCTQYGSPGTAPTRVYAGYSRVGQGRRVYTGRVHRGRVVAGPVPPLGTPPGPRPLSGTTVSVQSGTYRHQTDRYPGGGASLVAGFHAARAGDRQGSRRRCASSGVIARTSRGSLREAQNDQESSSGKPRMTRIATLSLSDRIATLSLSDILV